MHVLKVLPPRPNFGKWMTMDGKMDYIAFYS